MIKEGGYAYTFDVNGIRQETSTFTCFHCGKIVAVKPKCDPADLGGLCYVCMKMVCASCVDIGTCDPLEKKLERAENSYHARRSYGEL